MPSYLKTVLNGKLDLRLWWPPFDSMATTFTPPPELDLEEIELPLFPPPPSPAGNVLLNVVALVYCSTISYTILSLTDLFFINFSVSFTIYQVTPKKYSRLTNHHTKVFC